MVTSVYVPFRPVSPIKTFKFATFGCSYALLPWKLNRYSCRVLLGIKCTALDQSELSNFVECTISTATTCTIIFGIITMLFPSLLLLLQILHVLPLRLYNCYNLYNIINIWIPSKKVIQGSNPVNKES